MGKKGISLLPPEQDPNRPINKILFWLTHTGRWLVMVTELIVIGAFLSRFYLDQKNADLSEQIRQQKAILESVAEFERDWQALQAKIALAEKHLIQQPAYLTPLQIIAASLPTNMRLESWSYKPETQEAEFIGVFPQERTLAQFLVNLAQRPEIAAIQVGTIKREPDSVSFRIHFSARFKTS